ncbi:PE-PPE domain-containing protein [Tsukamurella sp. 1534]|uniref:PE-PPE domain-containing protein n=1 Tax=Tsukamurella sp. 1534 TaxID=1151061 RepID=UPI0011D2A731|nr:PE-PPE domain-containing protein [Tsukamurella sp. 1534]
MTSRHRRATTHRWAAAATGAGLAGTLALTAPAATGFLVQALAKTIVVVPGANDPTGADQWRRIGGDYTGPPPIIVHHPAQMGIGFPGFALSGDRRTTYDMTIDQGADATVAALLAAQAAGDGEVVVYALSQGTDVAAVALVRYGGIRPAPADGTARLTVIEQGGPSFVRTGVWNFLPPVLPGARTGLVTNDGIAGATVVGICIKGDMICGAGNPVATVFYALPGQMIHGNDYSAAYIGRFSPVDGEPFTPGSRPETPVRTATVVRDGRTVVEATYADGSTTRTWVEGDSTWVVVDTGENPWTRLFRSAGLPVPRDFDRLLNAVVPVPEPGARTPLSALVPAPAATAPAGSDDAAGGRVATGPNAITSAESTAADSGGRHVAGMPGGIPATRSSRARPRRPPSRRPAPHPRPRRRPRIPDSDTPTRRRPMTPSPRA